MRFLRLDLWWIWPVAFVAILIAGFLLQRRALAFPSVSLLRLSTYRASRVRYLPLAVIAVSLGLVLAALMEPVIPYSEREVAAKGLDIVLVVDLSLSMYDPIGLKKPSVFTPASAPTPTEPRRIDATKDALRTFISLRREDRIGIVVFSDNAYIVCPLTLDREHLLNYFDLIDPKTLTGEGLTGIGEGIAAASGALDRQSSRGVSNKVIVVFTDGANTAGRDPIAALQEATFEGVRVHLVGIDLSSEMKRSPQVAPFIDAVRAYGGRYFGADSKTQLEAAARSLDEIEKGYLTIKTYVRNDPVGHWFALSALMLLAVALALRVLPVFVPLH